MKKKQKTKNPIRKRLGRGTLNTYQGMQNIKFQGLISKKRRGRWTLKELGFYPACTKTYESLQIIKPVGRNTTDAGGGWYNTWYQVPDKLVLL